MAILGIIIKIKKKIFYADIPKIIAINWHINNSVLALLILLGILDVLFVCHAYQSTLNKGASVQLVFGFEYAILLTIVLNIVIKYAFHVNDFHELPWENKAVFLLYTELIMGKYKTRYEIRYFHVYKLLFKFSPNTELFYY